MIERAPIPDLFPGRLCYVEGFVLPSEFTDLTMERGKQSADIAVEVVALLSPLRVEVSPIGWQTTLIVHRGDLYDKRRG